MADPITGFMTIMQVLEALSGPVQGQPNTAQATQPPTMVLKSLAETSKTILKCYHPTGRYSSVELLEKPWSKQAQYNAESSAVIEIDWNGGFLNTPYKMLVVIVARDNEITVPILADNAQITASAKCPLNGWVKIDTPSNPTNKVAASTVKTPPAPDNQARSMSAVTQSIVELIDTAELVAQGGPSVSKDTEAVSKDLLAQLARKVLAAKRAIMKLNGQ